MRTSTHAPWAVLMTLPGLMELHCNAQPIWTSIAHEPTQYFRFWYEDGPRSIENTSYAHNNLREFYRFAPGPVPERTTCMQLDRASDSGIGGDGPVYWYTPEGIHLDHQFPKPYPSEFTVSRSQHAIRGFAITASIMGTAGGGGNASANAYFTNRPCSDGGIEYGLFRDLADESVAIYWATYANCGNNSRSVCRKLNDASFGKDFSNVQQENAGQIEHGFRIYGLDPKAQYTYRIYAADRGFHIEVLQGNRPAECADQAGGGMRICTFTKDTGTWFPIASLARGATGYIVIGTQTLEDPKLSEDARFDVSEVAVAKAAAAK
jgi:hypothetical protein